MKLILTDCGSGAIHDLVNAAAGWKDGVIICPTVTQLKRVKGAIKHKGVDNVYAYTVDDVVCNNALKNHPHAYVFVLEAQYTMRLLLQKHGMTGTIEMMSASI